jgi:hypothetical protein
MRFGTPPLREALPTGKVPRTCDRQTQTAAIFIMSPVAVFVAPPAPVVLPAGNGCSVFMLTLAGSILRGPGC